MSYFFQNHVSHIFKDVLGDLFISKRYNILYIKQLNNIIYRAIYAVLGALSQENSSIK